MDGSKHSSLAGFQGVAINTAACMCGVCVFFVPVSASGWWRACGRVVGGGGGVAFETSKKMHPEILGG